MADLLFWNTLIESAIWLSETLGKKVTPQSLIQKILDRAELDEKSFSPTIIKAVLPRDLQLASLILFPKEGDIGELETHMNERMTKAHGTPFIKGSIYTGYLSAKAIPLYRANLADLIIHGNVEISLIHENQLGGYKFRDSEYGYVLPIGAKHLATIETCGINRDDLVALANQLGASDVQASTREGKEKKKLPWQILCEEQRDDVYLAQIASGKAAPKTWVAQELAGRCKKKGYVTANGAEVDAGYIERLLLREWEPPKPS